MAINWSLETSENPDYFARRGQEEGKLDLNVNLLRVLLEIADLTQDMGRPTESLSHLTQSFTLELNNQGRLQLDEVYSSYLR